MPKAGRVLKTTWVFRTDRLIECWTYPRDMWELAKNMARDPKYAIFPLFKEVSLFSLLSDCRQISQYKKKLEKLKQRRDMPDISGGVARRLAKKYQLTSQKMIRIHDRYRKHAL